MEKETVEAAVIVAGIVIGSLTMSAAVWVWVRKQQFGYPGTLLSFFGTLLIGLSVFSKAQISIGDVEIIVERLQREVATLENENEALAQANEAISTEFVKLARNVETQREQFLAMGNAIRRTNPTLEPRLGEVMQELNEIPRLDHRALEAAIDRGRIATRPDSN